MTLKSNFKFPYFVYQSWFILWSILLIGMLSGCATDGKRAGAESSCLDNQQAGTQELPPEAFKNADDLLTVDCLLPGQLIQIGMHNTWMTPPRPAIISAWQCKVQGGQYSLTRSIDGRTIALKVWQQCANQGDKVAQNYMGEIYGRSWGQIKPDYIQAAKWYRKAAEQGNSRAQNNLGFLYEQGLGVAKNNALALKFYRQAMGAVEPIKLDQTTKVEINELESKLGQAMQTTRILQNQLNESEEIANNQQIEIDDLKRIQGSATDIQVQLGTVQNKLAETRRRESTLKIQLSDAKKQLNSVNSQISKTETRVAFKDIPNLGKYYALIIGINDYQFPLQNLKTPVNDAKRVEALLRQKYGFDTTLLINDGTIKPTRQGFNKAMRKFIKKIKEGDNFLIYFAGHGDLRSNRAHWLPQDAEFEDDTNWLSTDDITKKIEYRNDSNSIKARHVLIIADSCYSAAMATSWLEPLTDNVIASIPSGLVTRAGHYSTPISSQTITPALLPQPEGLSVEGRVGWIRAQYQRRSRKELTSGGIEPVLDNASRNGLSVFANAFSDMLEVNEGIIGASEIYAKIGPQVAEQVKKMGMNQTPVYAPIPNTGDNHGEFFFISR